MGRKKFLINLPSHFGKKTISNFNLDKKFFEFSDFFLIENYSVNFLIEVEKKNLTAWDIRSQKFQGGGLKSKALRLTFRDLASYVCKKTREWLVKAIRGVRVSNGPGFFFKSFWWELKT